MDAERWQKLKEIFNEAAEMPAAERAGFVSAACGADAAMRAEIEKMLVYADDEDTVFDNNAFEILAGDGAALGGGNGNGHAGAPGKGLPERIGKYKIEREIGRGGMGVVYEAVREAENFRQRVALKVIKRGMDTDAILNRFRHEQQILASLEHPNIARFLDGGVTDDGLTYYAMEYVEGVPLDDYAREKGLSVNGRLELFRQICAAVQFAHKNFVIHRDLKPSNILVTPDGTAKLLDFGIAKILSAEAASAATIGTATALGMMTPAYASPEQIRGERVNTATDVYSLGVVLYELLTGSKPYRLSFTGSQQELIKAICDSEPLKPSAVSEKGRRGEGEKARRGEEEKAIIRETAAGGGGQTENPKSEIRNPKSEIPFSPSQLRGDLDNIVLKALRKEPENRYASVEQFSEDVRRYLAGMPVIARRSTFKYRAGKFIRRNRLAVVAGLLIFASLVAGIAAASWQAYEARREREIAERRFEDVRELANKVVFKYHDAIAALPGSTEAREMLVKDATEYLDKLAQDAQANPALAQELALSYLKIGNVQGESYRANLGDSEGALSSYGKSVRLLEELNRRDPQNIEYRRNLRDVYRQISGLQVRLENWREAAEAARKHLDLCREILARDPENVQEQFALARAYFVQGDAAEFDGSHDEVIRLFRLALAETEKIYEKSPEGELGRTVLTASLQRLGTRLEYKAVYLQEKNAGTGSPPPSAEIAALFEEAERLHRRSVELSYALMRDFPNNEIYARFVYGTEINHGTALARIGRGAEGLPMIERSLVAFRRTAAADPKNAEAKRDTAECLQYLAFAHAAAGDVERAVAANQQSLAILEEITAADPSNFEFLRQTHLTFNNTGDLLLGENRLDDALAFYRRGATYAEKMSAFNKSPQIAVLQSLSDQKIGEALLALAEKNKSEAARREAIERLTRARSELISLRERGELGKNYEFRIEQLDREISRAD